VFVKICGTTRPADAVAAVGAGADAIGLNFVEGSVRQIDVAAAREILAAIARPITTVGIFRGFAADEILGITGALGLDAAQLHGDEPPAFTAAVAAEVRTVIKAVAAGDPAVRDIGEHAADIVMLDAPAPGGGTPFDWDLVGDLVTEHRILLAGGLRPDNVAEAIRRVRPWGVDVASGVESRPGRKDATAVARFAAEARAAGGRTGSPGAGQPA
jgi:phosphoribosylanthranilate isomerase